MSGSRPGRGPKARPGLAWLVRLEQSRRDIRRSLVEVNAARLRLEQQQARLSAGINRYDEQARVAPVAGEDDPAWQALQRKQEAVARRSEMANDLSSLITTHDISLKIWLNGRHFWHDRPVHP